MLGIITAISAMVLVSFTGLHEGAAVNRAARELALAIRRAQNMSFAVTRVDTAAGPKIPPAVGVRVDAGSPIYFIFADIAQDNRYSAGVQNGAVDAKVVNGETTMDRGITVSSLTAFDSLMQPRGVPAAHIVFLAPEAAAVLSDAGGVLQGDVLEIELASASGAARKKVVVRTSGQISIK